jgi:hypothetical protein
MASPQAEGRGFETRRRPISDVIQLDAFSKRFYLA